MFGKFGKKTKTVKQRKAEEYQKLGQQIEAMYDTVNPSRAQVYRTAFLRGIAQGVGGVVGATIVVALLIWLLSLFQEIPVLGHLMDSIQNTLESRK